MKKFLFVCSANLHRSPTAESVCRDIARKYHIKLVTHSAGISLGSPNPLTKELVRWADQIFVMEENHKYRVMELDRAAEGKIIVLDIPDIYNKNDPELVSILKDKLLPFILGMR